MGNDTGSTRWGIIVALFSLGASTLAWTLSGGAVFSPGPLNAERDSLRLGGVTSHAELSRRCGACHPAPLRGKTMSELCTACHTAIAAQLADSTTFHGSLEGAGACLGCHTEHGGPAASVTRFAGSGVAHDRFGFSLGGHRETASGRPFACTDCHTGRRFTFPAERCQGCHRDYQAQFIRKHSATWGSDCRSCHDGLDRFGRSVFRHDSTSYPLTGEHRRVACGDCHTAVRAFAAFRSAPTECNACHQKDDRHRGGFGGDCAACHETSSWEGARFEHTFPIDHGERGRVACRTCHPQQGSWKTYTCYGCHEHTPAQVAGKHRDEGIGTNLENCVRCHATGREEEGEGEGHHRDD
jgi:cytochrome c7-like protein